MDREYIGKPMMELDPTHNWKATENERNLQQFFGPHNLIFEKRPLHLATGSDIKQVGGTHYQTPIQPWDYIVANNLGYLEGNVIKYVSRYKQKNGLEDLKKAKHYLEKLMEGIGGA